MLSLHCVKPGQKDWRFSICCGLSSTIEEAGKEEGHGNEIANSKQE